MIKHRDALLEHITSHPASGSVSAKRAAFEARMNAPEGGDPEIHGGVEGLRFGENPIDALWFHGGGYVMGAPETHVAPMRYFAQESDLTLFAPRYRRAPEYVWPSQLEDADAVIDALPGKLVLVGDSAGGHLALNLALDRPDRFRALILFSPNTDRSRKSNTRAANTPLDPMNSDEGDRELFEMSMPGVAPDDPQASPLLADLSGLPPTFIAASEGEVLLGDTLLLARKLEEQGVKHHVEIAPYDEAGLHMFQNWPDVLPVARRTLDAAIGFVEKQG